MVDQQADEPNRCSSDVVIWRKDDVGLVPCPRRELMEARRRLSIGGVSRVRLGCLLAPLSAPGAGSGGLELERVDEDGAAGVDAVCWGAAGATGAGSFRS